MNRSWNRLRFRSLAVEQLEGRRLLAGDAGGGVIAADQGAPLAEGESPATLQLMVRDSYLSGIPFLVRVQVEGPDGRVDREVWDADFSLSTDNPAVVLLYDGDQAGLFNGMGSVLVTVQGNQEFSLTAHCSGATATKHLAPLSEAPVQEYAGTLPGEKTTFSGVVRVTGDLTVPPGHLLQIDPGTLVLIQGVPQAPQVQLGSQIVVQGTLSALGTAERPVTLTAADPSRPWSELDVQGGSVQLDYTEITRAGTSPRGGHTNSGPAVRLRDNGSLAMDHSSITDIRGKIMQATSGSVVMSDVLMSRAVMGPEIENTALELRDSWVIEMAGVYHHNGTVDDNDGIYLHRQSAGQTIHLSGGVIANVQDDGIDTLGARALIEDYYVSGRDDLADKAISVFDGEVTIERCLLTNTDIGVETKGAGNSTPHTHINRTTIANTRVGISARDKDTPDPNVVITYNISNSIIDVRDGGDPVRTDYAPADLHINYSSLVEAWNHPGSGTGNLHAQPLFVDAATHDYHLHPDSPAIDAGDPAATPDPDGTRLDLGYFPFVRPAPVPGDFNGDRFVDAQDIDLLSQAIRAGSTEPQFDLDGSGQLDQKDLQYMVRDLLHTTAGDANLDGAFNSDDLIQAFQGGEYEDNQPLNSGWATGDWDGDGEFISADLIVAFQAGRYELASPAAHAGDPTDWAVAIDDWFARLALRTRRGAWR